MNNANQANASEHKSVTILLAPSKTMDFVTLCPTEITPNRPHFIVEADIIASKVRKLSPPKLVNLMHVSKPIAQEVHGYYADWSPQAASKPALWAYSGDVYKGLQPYSMTQTESDWAQDHLLIASGLYGLLRPYDGIQKYRLEMKASLSVGRQRTLFEFWSGKLTAFVNQQDSTWLCNCSSDEYARATLKGLNMIVVTPVFLDHKPDGTIGTVPIYSKMMRGVMARWMIDHQVTTPAQLKAFNGHNYRYDAARSAPGFPAFIRDNMTPLKFT